MCEHKQLPPGAAGLAAVHAAPPQSARRARVEPERLLGPERDLLRVRVGVRVGARVRVRLRVRASVRVRVRVSPHRAAPEQP